MLCFFCGHDLGPLDVSTARAGQRVAFDPELGRLWRVCPACRRWSATPLEDRWEVLEACERAAGSGAKTLLESERLALLKTRAGELIRVGQPPRAEFARWRYSRLLDSFDRRSGFVARLLRLPLGPAGGYIGADFHGGVATVPAAWIGSPFVESSGVLTTLFASIPLAPECPGCRRPLFIAPHHLAAVRLARDMRAPVAIATCALCGVESAVGLRAARPALRTALAIIERDNRDAETVTRAAARIDTRGGARAYIENLAKRDATVGALSSPRRMALWISLDEDAEVEALEVEWRRAEELAAITDGELTEVPGFAEFRARILGVSLPNVVAEHD